MFYTECPHFIFLEEHGIACRMAQIRAVGEGNAKGERVIDGAVEAFLRVAVKLANIDPGLLQPLGDYFRKTLVCRENEFCVYYQDEGETRVLKFAASDEPEAASASKVGEENCGPPHNKV